MDMTGSQTSTTLLRQVAGKGSLAAEAVFFERYSRMARAVARASGTCAQDCDDIAQEAMTVAMQGLRDGRYDREKGGFKAWFKGILRNKIAHARRASSRTISPAATLPDAADPYPGPAEAFETAYEAEWRRIELERTEDMIRAELTEPTTWQAYYLTARKNWSPRETAKHLGISRGAVDQAKRRVIQRLRELLADQE